MFDNNDIEEGMSIEKATKLLTNDLDAKLFLLATTNTILHKINYLTRLLEYHQTTLEEVELYIKLLKKEHPLCNDRVKKISEYKDTFVWVLKIKNFWDKFKPVFLFILSIIFLLILLKIFVFK